MFKSKKYCFLILLFTCKIGVAQNPNERLAINYAQEGDCEKAVILFEELVKTKQASKAIYQSYQGCLENKKDYNSLYALSSYFYKRYQEPDYGVDEAYFLELSGESKKAKKAYQNLIDNAYKDVFNSLTLSNALRSKQQYDKALEVLLKNQDYTKDYTRHAIAIAQIEYLSGNKEKAFNTLLDYTNNGTQNFEQVLASLPAYLQEETDYALIKKLLILRIRNSDFSVFYEEMLSWVFVQQKDWKSAFVHYRSISNKKNDQGRTLLNLASICTANNAYEDAANCYKYVMDLGANGLYFNQAQNGWLSSRYSAVIKIPFPDTAQILALEKDYLVYINAYRNNPYAALAMRQLSEIYIKQLQQPKKAIALLQEAIKSPSVGDKFKAECKLDLGDAYLFDGDIWESELLYAQVDKSFKEDELGQEAKYRKAKLAYYRGEFSWAETQLEVLKGATSQLISNNAIELALHIQDNLGLDSNYIAMELYAQAELLLYQNKSKQAMAKVDQIDLLFPSHSLIDEVLYLKARVFAREQNWNIAIIHYKKIIDFHQSDILYDNALFELASIYEQQFKDTTNAMLYLEKIILEQKGSLFVVDASARYRALRGDVIMEQKNYFFEP